MTRRAPGPGEVHTWPDQLTARVVDTGPPVRLHGYAVAGDLARHYGPGEIARLALVGELPDRVTGAALDLALVYLAPIGAGEAPSHAAGLSRLMGGRPAAVVAVAALALSEQAAELVGRHGPWLRWLEAPEGPRPAGFAAADDAERALVAGLRERLGEVGFPCAGVAGDPSLEAALLAVLHGCGLRDGAALEAVVAWARLPVAVAEALAAPPLDLPGYPFNLPPFRYVEGDDDEG